MTQDAILRPLFRWPGGKRWLRRLVALAPQSFERYFEPFFGAGALFFALRPRHAVLSDANADLMHCYEAIRDHPDEVARVLSDMPRDAASYYRIRSQEFTTTVESAARFVYLTTLAFNGIYRVNRAGKFNVPYGGREYGDLAKSGRLTPYSNALKGARIRAVDFQDAVEGAGFWRPCVFRSSVHGRAFQQRVPEIQPAPVLLGRPKAARKHRKAARPARLPGDCQQRTSRSPSGPSTRASGIFVARHSVMAADSRRRSTIEEYLITNAE